MKCTNCSTENQEGNLFCGKCGAPFPAPEQVQVTKHRNPLTPQVYIWGRKVEPVFIFIGFLLVCLVMALPIVSSPKETTSSQTPATGRLAESTDRLFKSIDHLSKAFRGDQSVDNSATTYPREQTTLQPQQPKLGDTVQKSGYTLSAVAVSDPATPGRFYKPASGKNLIAVEVVVGNVSGHKITVNSLGFVLVDQDGFVYKSELGALDKELELVEIGPGEKVKGWVAFQVPTGAIGNSIRYQNSSYPEIVLQTGLSK